MEIFRVAGNAVIFEDFLRSRCERIGKGQEGPERVGTFDQLAGALDVAQVASVTVAKGERQARHDVRGVDKTVDGNFPKLLGKFGVPDSRTAEGVAGGDTVGRTNARGGDSGERSAETVAGDIER